MSTLIKTLWVRNYIFTLKLFK